MRGEVRTMPKVESNAAIEVLEKKEDERGALVCGVPRNRFGRGDGAGVSDTVGRPVVNGGIRDFCNRNDDWSYQQCGADCEVRPPAEDVPRGHGEECQSPKCRSERNGADGRRAALPHPAAGGSVLPAGRSLRHGGGRLARGRAGTAFRVAPETAGLYARKGLRSRRSRLGQNERRGVSAMVEGI